MQQNDGHEYSSLFFDYTDAGAGRSAERFVGTLQQALSVGSVADFGCGRGVWLEEWRAAGVNDVVGVDGDYIVRSKLRIPEDQFRPHDIAKPIDLGRQFDIVQSLEVAEHLPANVSSTFIDTLTAHGKRILFSAAVPGQGGEYHINEQPLEYWRALFGERGYVPYDFMRPRFARDPQVEPWYRFNTILYVNAEGAEDLPDAITATRVQEGEAIADYSNLTWKLRRAIVGRLPQSIVNRISQLRAEMIARRASNKAGG